MGPKENIFYLDGFGFNRSFCFYQVNEKDVWHEHVKTQTAYQISHVSGPNICFDLVYIWFCMVLRREIRNKKAFKIIPKHPTGFVFLDSYWTEHFLGFRFLTDYRRNGFAMARLQISNGFWMYWHCIPFNNKLGWRSWKLNYRKFRWHICIASFC